MVTLPEVILFDLDGTLIENSEAVVDAYHTGLLRYNYPVKEKEYIASLAGLSTIETAKALNVKEKDWMKIDAHFWEYFHNYADDPNSLPIIFDKVIDLLEFCTKKDITIAIVTSNEAKIAEKMIKKVNIKKYFDVIVGSEDVINKKPSSDPIVLAFKRLNIELDITKENQDKYWFVGDTQSDVGAAKNSGLLSIAIPQPHTLKTVIKAEPEYLIANLTEFYKFISNL